MLGTQSRRHHRDCRPTCITHAQHPQEWHREIHLPWLILRENPNQAEDHEHHRLKVAARSHCTVVASTDPYKTQRQEEGVLPFSGFLSGHPGLKHGFVTEKSELVDRWETARLCPWESQKIGQFAKEFTSWYENHLFPLITGRFSSRQRAGMNRFKEWGLGKTPCTHSEQTRSFFFFFWQCCAASRILVPQFSSVAQPCPTLFDPMNYSTAALPVHHQLPEPTQTHVHWVGDAIQPSHLIICRPLLLLPSIFPSIRVFSNESALLIRWPKYWSFSFNISSSSEHLGLISFRMDWLNLLAVQGTRKSLLQHHSSKASIICAQLSF